MVSFAIATTCGASCWSKNDAEIDPPLPEPPSWNADCDPIVPSHCGFPFPSNTALVDDASTKTGKRVAFKAGALPLHNQKSTDPAAWADADGFSPAQRVVPFLPGATITILP